MKIKFILNLLLFCFVTAANAQQTTELTADKHNEYGLIYTLPVTQLRVDVTFEKLERIAGDFNKYAKKYIGTNNVVTENSTSWIIRDVKLTPFGIADENAQFLMRFKSSSPGTICVAPDNMLLAINRLVTDYETQTPQTTPLVLVEPGLDVEEYLNYMGEDFLGSQSLAKRAQFLSESLLEVRDARNELAKGTGENVPTDGKQLQLMLSDLEKQARAMTTAFTGTSRLYRQTISYYLLPREEGEFVLFRMSDFAGPVAVDNYAGIPVKLKLKIESLPKLPIDIKGEEKKIPKEAVIYNIPARCSIQISSNGETLYQNPDVRMSQFGIQFGLDPAIFSDKKDPAYAVFDPVTGALKTKGLVREITEE